MCRRHLPVALLGAALALAGSAANAQQFQRPVAELSLRPELAAGAGPAEHAGDRHDIPAGADSADHATSVASRPATASTAAQPAPSEPQRRPQPLGSSAASAQAATACMNDAEVGFGRHRDQGLRRRDRRDAEESRQRLLLPRQRQVRQERLRRRDRRLRPGAAARSVGPRLSQQPRRGLRSQEGYRPRARRLQRGDQDQSRIRSTPTTIAARSFSARATSPAPPPTTAR